MCGTTWLRVSHDTAIASTLVRICIFATSFVNTISALGLWTCRYGNVEAADASRKSSHCCGWNAGGYSVWCHMYRAPSPNRLIASLSISLITIQHDKQLNVYHVLKNWRVASLICYTEITGKSTGSAVQQVLKFSIKFAESVEL